MCLFHGNDDLYCWSETFLASSAHISSARAILVSDQHQLSSVSRLHASALPTISLLKLLILTIAYVSISYCGISGVVLCLFTVAFCGEYATLTARLYVHYFTLHETTNMHFL